MFRTFPIRFQLPSNAVLTFDQLSGGNEIDPVTGNVTPVVNKVDVNASLTELGNQTKENDQVGLDTRFRSMRGYLLGTIPDGIQLNGRVPCTIGDQSGTFHFTETLTPFKTEIQNVVGGIPIQGSFQTEGGGR